MNDVPLICDPVPGPTIITIPNVLSKADLERLREAWAAAAIGVPRQRTKILDAGRRFEPVYCQRTEWPDAEFTAA